MKKSYLFLAEGFEEVEALSVIDVLRRGGVDVSTVSISERKEVTGAHCIRVTADLSWKEFEGQEAECLIFPGGMPGAKNLGEFSPLIEILQHHYNRKRLVAAICAAPALVLGQLVTERRLRITAYPGFDELLTDADISSEGVVVTENVITGKGPAYALEFGLKILETLRSREKAEEVASGLLMH